MSVGPINNSPTHGGAEGSELRVCLAAVREFPSSVDHRRDSATFASLKTASVRRVRERLANAERLTVPSERVCLVTRVSPTGVSW